MDEGPQEALVGFFAPAKAMRMWRGSDMRTWKLKRAIGIALLAPAATGAVRGQTYSQFSIPTPDSVTLSLANGPDGAIWFAERDGNKIGRVDAAGAITEFPVPRADSKPREIVLGPDGNLWFIGRHTGSLDFSLWRTTPEGVFTEFQSRRRPWELRGLQPGPMETCGSEMRTVAIPIHPRRKSRG